jgi:hypothetical protein
MKKIIFKSSILLSIVIASFIIYLSAIGVETNKFNSLIKKKSNEVNKYIKLDFNKTKIYLNVREFNLTVKLQKPIILIKKNKINLSRLDLFIPIKSFLNSDFLLERVELVFFKNDIKDLAKITNIFLPSIINKKLNKIFSEGILEGEFIIPFDKDGKIGKNYGFSGKASNALINLNKDFVIKNLTTYITHSKNSESNTFNIVIEEGVIDNIKLAKSKINVIRKKNETEVKSQINTSGKVNFKKIKKISSLFKFDFKGFKNIDALIALNTNINFNINDNLNIKDLSYSVEGSIPYIEILHKDIATIKNYLPDYNSKLVLKNSDIKFNNWELGSKAEISGFIEIDDHLDKIKINQNYKKNKKTFEIIGSIDLTNSKVDISKLNYNKEKGQKSEVDFDINFIMNNYYEIKSMNFFTKIDKISIYELNLNQRFQVDNFKSFEVKTFKEKIENNNFSIQNDKEIIISGDIFDAQPLLKSLYKDNTEKTFSKKFNRKIKINFNKALTGTNDDVSNFSMIASINSGSYDKLLLKGNFSDNEIIEVSIYKINDVKKTLQVISDRARPFIKNFDFVEGFEGGRLEYDSILTNKISNSNLTITNFKVSKVPALAKLLTLASLQGIADTLSGDGIRFESFEMKTNSKGNIMNIEDALATGPAVSILLEGYVDKGKTVSLRGTLVPATKLNSIIASIPVVGDILVGKKTGDGVVGVSFKMKGPPKDIKTSVNPIKTLTPRFIVRAIEKRKKKKEMETK